MADNTAQNSQSADEHSPYTHLCEHPNCTNWGGFGYDVDMGQTQWFCGDHRWDDYRLGKPRRTWRDIETSTMNATEIPARAISVR